jgi:hypothetical protein
LMPAIAVISYENQFLTVFLNTSSHLRFTGWNKPATQKREYMVL